MNHTIILFTELRGGGGLKVPFWDYTLVNSAYVVTLGLKGLKHSGFKQAKNHQ